MPTAPWATPLPSDAEMLESYFDEFYTAIYNLEANTSMQDAHTAAGVQSLLETIHVVCACVSNQRVVYRLVDTPLVVGPFFQSGLQPRSGWNKNQ